MKNIFDFQLLLASPLFAKMTRQDLEAALTCLGAVERSYPKGAVLLESGAPVRSVGLVVSGKVHVLREDFWGNQDLIAPVRPGELFGEAYACAGEDSGVTVTAAENTTVLFLEVARMLHTCPSGCAYHAQLIQNLLHVMVRKNLQLNAKLSHVTRRLTRDKVLAYLSAEAARAESPEFSIPFNRQQLADYLAVDRSALSAELSKLRREGYLTFHKNYFTLLREAEE